jgi:hypothetical protein
MFLLQLRRGYVHLPATACPDPVPTTPSPATMGRNNYLLLLPPIPLSLSLWSLHAREIATVRQYNILNLSNLWIDDEADPGDCDEEDAGNIHLRSNEKCLRI